jgi:hypothetical protein
MGNRLRSGLGSAVAVAAAVFGGLLIVDLIFEGHAPWFEEILFAIVIAVIYFVWGLVRPRRGK